jgi:hypothetical protein
MDSIIRYSNGKEMWDNFNKFEDILFGFIWTSNILPVDDIKQYIQPME